MAPDGWLCHHDPVGDGLLGRQADWLVGAGPTLADLALVAYTRVAHEGDFDLSAYPAVVAWIARVEDAFGIR